MKTLPRFSALVFISTALLMGVPAQGQWASQTITLSPGWNAVYLEIQPVPEECETIFAGLPVESVWMWNRRFSSVQFIQDPAELVPGQPDWLLYLPPTNQAQTLVNLFILQGARPYLVKLADNAASMNLTLKGRPLVRRPDWLSDTWNFVGFPVASNSPPTFRDFFAASAAHSTNTVYRLNSAGSWQAVTSPNTTPMRSGEAFWIRTTGQSTYSGPMNVGLEQSTGLDYGRLLTEQTIRVRNNSPSSKTYSLRLLTSENPPTGQPLLAGAVPLSYYRVNLTATANEIGWVPQPSVLTSAPVVSSGEWVVRLEARRRDMLPYSGPVGIAGVLYQGLLEVTDNAGGRQLVPVSSEGLQNFNTRSGLQLAAAPPATHPRTGLWVGSAQINAVNQPSNPSAPNTPIPVQTPLQFRLLLHVDQSGQTRLLQKVLHMWKDAVTNAAGEVLSPGHFVLVTDQSLESQFKGATLRDGVQVARRISSAAFSFRDPLLCHGPGDFGANTLSVTNVVPYDDPLNPFVHRYHPDHNNLDELYSPQRLPEGQESFTVTRAIELRFTATDPEGLTVAGWGDNQLGGNYRETMNGLHHRPLHLEGNFRLTRASAVDVLNDGL